MNDREREHINQIVEHARVSRQRAVAARIKSIFAAHAAKGLLHSGVTVVVSVRAMDEDADELLTELSLKVKAVRLGKDAFGILAMSVNEFLEYCANEQLPAVLKMASGRAHASPDPSIVSAAQKLFDEARADIEAKLSILSFEFDREPDTHVELPVTAIPAAPSIKRGGRPPAEFWDDMWADTAAKLYLGDLQPKTQADIERAMADWIESKGHSAGDSTIRGRARRLWDRINDPQA